MRPKKIKLGKNIRELAIEYARENKLPINIIDQIYKQYWKNIYDRAKSLDGFTFPVDNFCTITTSGNKCKKYLAILNKRRDKKIFNLEDVNKDYEVVKGFYETIISRKSNLQKIYKEKKLKRKEYERIVNNTN